MSYPTLEMLDHLHGQTVNVEFVAGTTAVSVQGVLLIDQDMSIGVSINANSGITFSIDDIDEIELIKSRISKALITLTTRSNADDK